MTLFRRILVPHDFSAPADRALAVATRLARANRGRLLLLHVVTPFQPVTTFPEMASGFIPEADIIRGERRRLEQLAARAVGRKGPPVTCRVVIGDPYHRIADAARDADSIVMATAGRTGLSHLLIGSVAEKVVRHSPVPVLAIPAGRKGRRSRRARA